MQELEKSKSNEQEVFKRIRHSKKSVKHFVRVGTICRSNGQTNRLNVGNEDLVVFKDVDELQVRNQYLVSVIRELTEMNKAMTTHWIITGDSDDELDQVGATIAIKKRLSMAPKELESLCAEREHGREMITVIVKQRDMYRVLLAQSDINILEGDAANSSRAQEGAALMEKSSSRHGSADVGVEKNFKEFDDYKMEKHANVKLLRERWSKNVANQMVANTVVKLEASTSRLQSLAVEKDSAVREVEFLRKNEKNTCRTNDVSS
ncbi:hypothetical protein PsorP6_015693 [Peronosclerospora sorghi]|uniref:Uncharacterized protein n=1 Tax=Peronosclerospora sorghi TaxID=230839 RepID=A0ACC0WN32_9STRA|nr:hypothetical protein PsorP6_015693 [Peronosclerospora sorghi]